MYVHDSLWYNVLNKNFWLMIYDYIFYHAYLSFNVVFIYGQGFPLAHSKWSVWIQFHVNLPDYDWARGYLTMALVYIYMEVNKCVVFITDKMLYHSEHLVNYITQSYIIRLYLSYWLNHAYCHQRPPILLTWAMFRLPILLIVLEKYPSRTVST